VAILLLNNVLKKKITLHWFTSTTMKNTFPFCFLLAILSICLSFNTLYAQGGSKREIPTGDRPAIGILKGKLIDEVTGFPIEYGSIAVLSKKDSSLAGGTISDPKGNFRIEQVKAGRYFIRIQFMGYETRVINDIVIRPDSPEISLGNVKLLNHATSLGGVEITAEKEMLVNNLDKKIINVDKSIAAVGGNAVDVMQSIPSVTVDVDGNVSLRGSSNITILIDGKPSGLSDISSGDLLQQIPASSIESVEVITNPSVRYDPEGTSGIINIVLKKKSLQGFNGMVSATAGTGDRYNGSVNLNVRRNRINLFAGFDSRIGRFNSTGETTRLTTYDSIETRLLQTQTMINERNSYNLNTGLDFLIDNLNTLTLSFQYRKMDFGNEGDILSRTFDSNDSLIRSFNRFNHSERDIESFTYNAAYKRTFVVKGRELTIDLMLNDNNMGGMQEIRQTEEPYLPEQPLTLQNAVSGNKNMMYMIQTNFITPIGKSGRIETGFKSTIRDQNMKNSLLEYYNNEWIEDSVSRNNFDYFEQIHAVYGIYSSSFKKLKYQVGLRFEQLISNSELKLNEEKFDRSYPDLYPSVHLVYEQSAKNQFILSYSRRVSRPNPRQLNPFVDYSDSLNIRFGNPRLDPEFIDSYELGWSGFWGKNSLNATTFYRYTSGIIENIVTLQENGVTSTTFENLTSGTNYGIELIANREFSSWLKANANFSFFKQLINGSEITGLEKVEGNMWTTKVNLTFNILKGATLLIAGNYESPEIEAQDREEEVYFADVALKYDFLKSKATVSLRVSDLFDTRRHNSETRGESFYITSKRRIDSRVGYIGFSYRINNYNRQRERDRNGQGEMEMEEF
jgi:outer membrane receptor protein involved in Fe transport